VLKILYYLVVINYTRGDDYRQCVIKPPPSRFENIFECFVDFHCRLFTGLRGDREKQFWCIKFKNLRVWLCEVMAVIVTPCVVIYHKSVEHLTLPRFWG